MRLLDNPTRNLFFTGKGGVGKTSMACASAVQLADRGLRVLLVSTDPASNLSEVLDAKIGNHPTPIHSVPNLDALNLDPQAAANEYREQMVAPYRGVLPDAAVRSMEEQFSGSCTLEIAAFNEFSRLIGDREATLEYDHLIFDTAPTGHTLRLLTLPSAWSGFMETNTTGTSCLGPLAGLQAQTRTYQQTVATLANKNMTTLVLVTRPESSAFREAARTSEELQSLGLTNQHLIVNGVFVADDPRDPIAIAMQRRGDEAIASIPDVLQTLHRTTVPISVGGMMGTDTLRMIGKPSDVRMSETDEQELIEAYPDGLGSLIDELAAPGHGVIMTMGKGGVGKTTIAAAIAVALAERGLDVHLSTTDPAAHLTTTIASKRIEGLTIGRIDPAKETAEYTAEVMHTAGKDLDADGKALLEEDLRSPCTEEIAVFRAFARAVADGVNRFVVLDTAPTGHTILLLDSALAYHREVTRQTSQMPETVENLLPRLRDPAFTRVLVVTLPEATPVHEAAVLQQDLRRAEIEPFAWIINQSVVPLAVTDSTLRCRQSRESQFIAEVQSSLATRVALISWQPEPPVGPDGLKRIVDSNSSAVR